MASLIFAHAKSIRNKAKKAARLAAINANSIEEAREIESNIYDMTVRSERAEFREILKIAQELHTDYVETTMSQTCNWFFITIRPDVTKITFEEFKIIVLEKYLKRKCFKEFTLSFEQKGTDLDTIGNGFHCHIVADADWRSKGEALRDTKSTFNKWVAPNCIEIKTTRNPDDIIDKYMIAYESDDGHKEVTKEWDKLWRQKLGLQEIYRKSDPACSSSPGTGWVSIRPLENSIRVVLD